jgi:hypothetical protein
MIVHSEGLHHGLSVWLYLPLTCMNDRVVVRHAAELPLIGSPKRRITTYYLAYVALIFEVTTSELIRRCNVTASHCRTVFQGPLNAQSSKMLQYTEVASAQ